MTDFCHCHCHSSRSFFDGLTPIEDLVARAAALGQPGIALTDHGNVFNAVQFFTACEKHGIKGIIGMEAYEAVPHQWDRERDKAILARKFDEDPRYHHLTLWVRDLQGWENLCALHTNSYTWNFKPKNQPLIDRAQLEAHHEGLMVGLGCLASKTNMALTRGEDAYEAAKFYVETFGADNVYCEVMGNLGDQQRLIRPQRALAQRLGVKVVGTNDVHYERQEQGRENGPHHILVQARAHRSKKAEDEDKSSDKSDATYGQWYGTDEFFLKSTDQMLGTGGIEAADLATSIEILDRVEFDFEATKHPQPPTAPVPAFGEDMEFDLFIAANT